MTEPPSTAAMARRRRRRWAGAAASVGLHVIVLAWLGWQAAPRPPERLDGPSRAVLLTLERDPSRTRPLAHASAPAGPSAPVRQAAAEPRPRPVAPVPSPLAPALPTVGAAPATTSPGVGGGTHPGPMPAGEPGADLRGFLRATVGCSHADYLRLSDAERARCDKGYGLAARVGEKLDMIPLEKRAAFSRQALADERKRSQREVALPSSPVVACTGPGSNLGFGCLPPEAIHGFKP